jgi:exopolyphosphatase/guanosine-5'-triphosphate,3'-diphosphate pyrophosphatase
MMIHNPVGDVNWWKSGQPTEEELHLSGGLLVEDWPHARHVMYLSNLLFEATHPLHKLDGAALRLLQRAAFLHNAGMMIEVRRHHKHSFRLIKETPLPDFTAEERYEIACIARYHRRALPSKDHEEFAILSPFARERVSQLAALLRVADALDYNHDGRVLCLSALPELCRRDVWTCSVQVRPLAELDDEFERARDKADLFEQEFHRKLHLLRQN